MAESMRTPSFAEYRTVGEAAAYLGVSPATLRNWDRSGKLKPRRHPQNGYRIYLHEELQSVLQAAGQPEVVLTAPAATVDWNRFGDSEHIVQFYETDAFLIDSLSHYVGSALGAGDAAIIIATAEHLAALSEQLRSRGIDAATAREQGRYVTLDATDTLASFMLGDLPDARRFNNTLGKMITQMTENGCRIFAFGEMVALLWAKGNHDAAIRLEELWNDLGKVHRFTLLCGYPMTCFDASGDSPSFEGVCNCHSRVLPTEKYASIDDRDDRLHAIAVLEQKSHWLAAEIAHRQAVENALAERQQELAEFFDNASEGIHKVNRDGTILWANKAEYELLGYTSDEVIGRSIAEFHADADVIADMLAKLQRGETLENFPARLRCKNGQIKHVLINSNACFKDGDFLYTRCFTRDVTRQWQAESALREANRRKDEFLATLAHELRNPLAPIRNAIELLKVDSDPETVVEVRGIMERQMKQMTRLVDDLLDISRISRDRLELRKERVELSSIIGSAVETARPLIEAAQHGLTINLPQLPIVLDADPMRLAQVFANLITNSAKYTEPGGSIVIDAEQAENEVRVTVRDNGIGIEPDALAYIFDMFRQVDQSLEKSQGGLGIGLTLVRRLVELHEGAITAHSEGRGKGSSFTVRLPIAQGISNAELPAPITPSRAARSGLQILVVDDNKDSADTLCLLLKIKKHEVRTARDGFEAIEMASTFQPDMILMDVSMPNLNGYDAARRIRQTPQGRDIFIVALTGCSQPEDVARSREAGCSAHLVKPVNFAALEELMKRRISTQH